MNRKTIYIIIILLLISGAVLFLYPVFSSYLAERHQARIIADYDESIQRMQAEKLEEEWKKAEEYNETLMGEPVHDPFLEGSGMALPENYLEVLHVMDSMGFIKIPKISVSLPIYHGTDRETLEKGVGHLRQTALPIGGEGNHTVLTGHTGLPNAKLFDGLTKITVGDHFYIQILGKTIAYEVDSVNVVKPEEVELLNPIRGEDHVTLLTCTPYGVNSHRLLVRGIRIPYQEESLAGEQDQPQGMTLQQQLILQALLAGSAAAVILLVMVFSYRKTKKRRKTRRRRTERSWIL